MIHPPRHLIPIGLNLPLLHYPLFWTDGAVVSTLPFPGRSVAWVASCRRVANIPQKHVDVYIHGKLRPARPQIRPKIASPSCRLENRIERRNGRLTSIRSWLMCLEIPYRVAVGNVACITCPSILLTRPARNHHKRDITRGESLSHSLPATRRTNASFFARDMKRYQSHPKNAADLAPRYLSPNPRL